MTDKILKAIEEFEAVRAKATKGPWYPLHNWGTEALNPQKTFGEVGILGNAASTAFIGQSYRADVSAAEKLEDNLNYIVKACNNATRFTQALRVAVEALSGVWGDEIALAEIERILE